MDITESGAKMILRRLMMAENLGDVHDAINDMHSALGFPKPEGNFSDGWTDADLTRVGFDV